MRHRKRRTAPFAWLSAALFWAMLVLAPFVAAKVISETFSSQGLDFDVNPASIAATRDSIDKRFSALMSGVPDKRKTWSRLVQEQVDLGRMRAARGFLLAAPNMLNETDAGAILASARAQALTGEEALEKAALVYLDEEAQYAYEDATSPLRAIWQAAVTDPVANTEQTQDTETTEENSDQTDDVSNDDLTESASVGLNVLGDERDLALQAARWVRGQKLDSFAFTLSGVGLSVLDPSARTGASIVRSADRAGRLNPDLKSYLQRILFMAAPPERIKRDLTVRFSGTIGIQAQGPIILEIIRSDINSEEMKRVEEQLRLIRDISLKTSASSAISILEHARNDLDLQRALLLTEAGGDKALALLAMEGGNALTAAKTPVKWTNRLRIMIALLVGMALTALWLTIETLLLSIRRGRPIRRSAVYGIDERDWDHDNRP